MQFVKVIECHVLVNVLLPVRSLLQTNMAQPLRMTSGSHLVNLSVVFVAHLPDAMSISHMRDGVELHHKCGYYSPCRCEENCGCWYLSCNTCILTT